MKRVILVGCGAMGREVLVQLRDDVAARVVGIIVPAADVDAVRGQVQALAPHAEVQSGVDLAAAPDLLVECAGHAAIVQHVLPALAAGVPAIVASIGALHDAALMAQLTEAATRGGTQVQLVAGAIGGIDALSAARLGGLTRVQYVGRKPPQSWRGTPAEALFDLDAVSAPVTLFEGSAREAARLYPKNANVAATVSLAGLGLDATQATLIADPTVSRNVHRLVAEGAFGRLDLTIENEPLAANPKTSALTVFSIVRAIHNATRAIAL